MDLKSQLRSRVLSLTPAQRETCLKAYYRDQRKLMQVKTQGIGLGGSVTCIYVSKTVLVRIKGKSAVESAAEAILRVWEHLIQSSSATVFSLLETLITDVFASNAATLHRPMSSFCVRDGFCVKSGSSPSERPISVNQSMYEFRPAMENEVSMTTKTDADELLQTTMMAKKLHKCLAEVREHNLNRAKAVIHKKDGTRGDLGSEREGEKTLGEGSLGNMAEKKRYSGSIIGLKPHSAISKQPSLLLIQSSNTKSYRSLAEARYEAKAKLAKAEVGLGDEKDSFYSYRN